MKKDNSNGCNRCGKCCYERYIIDRPPLNVFDIRRIEKITGKNRREFTQISHKRHSEEPYVTLRYVGEDRHCLFLLINNDGTTTCSIYKARPRSCRLYPRDTSVCYPEKRKIHRNDFTRVLKHIITL